MTFLIELYETFKPVLVGPAILLVLCLMAWGSKWISENPDKFNMIKSWLTGFGIGFIILLTINYIKYHG